MVTVRSADGVAKLNTVVQEGKVETPVVRLQLEECYTF